MQYLPLPCADATDDAVVNGLCKKEPWLPHLTPWLAAYTAYRGAGADPWIVAPATFDPDIAAVQYALYDSRKQSGPLRKIRQTAGLLSCPMCGSPTTGSLDHLLPRAVYPEFSIMRANLVPACVHCNSAAKGNKHRGDTKLERFIHPYFDHFANQPLWLVRINPPFAAATFDAIPLADPEDPVWSIVSYHLSHVLGDEFRRRMESLWSTLPASMHVAASGDPINVAFVTRQINIDMERAIVTDGVNGWTTAFLRGLTMNPDAMANVEARTAAFPV